MSDEDPRKAEVLRLLAQGVEPAPLESGKNITVNGNNNLVAAGDLWVAAPALRRDADRETLLARRAAAVERFRANKQAMWLNAYVAWFGLGLVFAIMFMTRAPLLSLPPFLPVAVSAVAVLLPSYLMNRHRQQLMAENAALFRQVQQIDDKLAVMP